MCRCAGVWREEEEEEDEEQEEEGCGRWRTSEKTPALVGSEGCSSCCIKRVQSCDPACSLSPRESWRRFDEFERWVKLRKAYLPGALMGACVSALLDAIARAGGVPV